MDMREIIKVNGIVVRLNMYTEKRASELDKVNSDVKEYLEKITKKDPDVAFRAVPKKIKADFWMRKAQILWDPQEPEEKNEHWDDERKFLSRKLFEDPEFEYSLLERTEVFFMNQEVYL